MKATLSGHAGRHEWKAGIDMDAANVRERLAYQITDLGQFDPGTPQEFAFDDTRPDREQSAFVQDQVRVGAWTVTGGMRWDRYRLVVADTALSPRAAIAWSSPAAGLVLRASYDRAFQTPAVENLLVASSSSVDALNDSVLRLSIKPSRGDFYEAGCRKPCSARHASTSVTFAGR